jgi:spore maturation protein CgeB
MVNGQDYPEVRPVDRPKSFPGLRVGVILDEFSLRAWTPEFHTVLVTPKGWQGELEAEPIDLLLVESAWAGNHGAWQFQMTGSRAPRQELVNLVEHCKRESIPTVFWNKEDPSHFEDFIDTAKLFDYVFTTDSTLIPQYKEILGHDRVDSLSFAAQPSVHNPIRIRGLEQSEDMAFAGMYFKHKFPERREQMELLFGAAMQVVNRGEYGFDIFSRHHGGNENYQFPQPYDKHVVGALPYEKMLAAYRNYKVFLNVNSVTDSPSMCARRVFEILASGTPVVSGKSTAIPEFFSPSEVPLVEDERTAAYVLRSVLNSPQARDRMVHKAQRKIWNNHTYAHRAAKMLDAVGLDVQSPFLAIPSVSAIVSTNRPEFVRHAINSVAAQKEVQPELVLLTHGFQERAAELKAYAADKGIENFKLLHAPASDSLGSCLNQLVAASSGDIIANFDDDDFYGAYYLHDSLNAMRFSNADLVGKFATYMYTAADDMVTLRNPGKENMFTDFITGATFVGRHEVFTNNPFMPITGGEDSRFLESVDQSGGVIFASDRFNFLQVRGKHSHTWNVDHLELYANSVIETYGFNTHHVEI